MSENDFDSISEMNDSAQRALNESKREQLREEFGMEMSMTSPGLDPEVEGDFLNQVMEFERQWKSAEPTTVWKFIGEPEITHVDGLSKDEMSTEIKRIYEIMAEYGVDLSSPEDLDVKELYDFVTQDFMQEEIDGIKIPGMIHGFIYEEFFPEKYPFDESEYDRLNSAVDES